MAVELAHVSESRSEDLGSPLLPLRSTLLEQRLGRLLPGRLLGVHPFAHSALLTTYPRQTVASYRRLEVTSDGDGIDIISAPAVSSCQRTIHRFANSTRLTADRLELDAWTEEGCSRNGHPPPPRIERGPTSARACCRQVGQRPGIDDRGALPCAQFRLSHRVARSTQHSRRPEMIDHERTEGVFQLPQIPRLLCFRACWSKNVDQ
jgi:hypothetical protein